MAIKYPKFFQDEMVVWKKTFYSDITKDTPFDPFEVVFKIKSPSGTVYTPTIVDETGTGNYSAAKILDEYGEWNWRWMATGPVIVDQGTISVIPKNVD